MRARRFKFKRDSYAWGKRSKFRVMFLEGPKPRLNDPAFHEKSLIIDNSENVELLMLGKIFSRSFKTPNNSIVLGFP